MQSAASMKNLLAAMAVSALWACGGVSPGGMDAGDAGPTDAGPTDAGPTDAGPTDAGPTDAGPTDAGPKDAGPTPVVALSVNAVSVLFPLPLHPTDPGLLHLDEPGKGGPLLSAALFADIPVYSDNPLTERAYGEWRVVAARLDPCFPTHAFLQSDPSKCRRQLRLVAQPHPEGMNGGGSDDNTIHLLYDLTQAQFDDLAARWVAPLQDQAGARGESLQVSPRMKSEGLQGAYANGIRALIKEFAGPDTLRQVTFMEGRGVAWEFGGFMVNAGAHTSIQIPGLDGGVSEVTTANSNAPFTTTPRSKVAAELEPLAGRFVSDGGIGSGSLVFDATPMQMQAALQRSLDVDNPLTDLHPDSLDCSVCHIANRARARAIRKGQTIQGLSRYENARRPTTVLNASAFGEETMEQRAFGYHFGGPVVNQRVANESAEVADLLEKRLSPP